MSNHSNDPIDQAIDDVESNSKTRKVVFGIAIFCLISCLFGMFFLVTRLIVPSGYF